MRILHSRLEGRKSAGSPQFVIAFLLTLFLFLAELGIARASVTTMGLEQLVQASTDIVRGHVASQESRWNETNTQIVTWTTVAVEERFRGRAPATVVVEQPGGTVGNMRSDAAGAVRFQEGGDYVLFLEPSKLNPSRRLVVGMIQGAYRIYRDATTNEERVIQPSLKPVERDETRISEPAAEPPAGAETISLTQFSQQLSAALAAPVVVPKGSSIPVVIETTEFEGVGRMRIVARTTATLFPNSKTAIPAGSTVEGSAQKWQGMWKVYWTQVSVHGVGVPISGSSEELSEGLRGRSMMVKVQ
jgi:hypothetical protein